jgi:hypothetical protein
MGEEKMDAIGSNTVCPDMIEGGSLQ